MTDWSRWDGMNGHHVEPDWRPLSPADTITLGNGGATIGWGVPANIIYLEGPTGVDRDGPTPEEVAQGWVFGVLPTNWPDSQPQWLANDWGQFPYALGAPAGAVIQRFPIWYRWDRGSVQTSVPPTEDIPPPDATPILSSSDETWGVTIPQSFGTRRITGVPIWCGAVRRVAEHDFTGAVDFAVAFGYAARPEDDFRNVTLSKLFSNGKLIYDSAGGSPVTEEGVTVTFYPGLPDAMPDPTVTAANGAATPAFRNMYYVVIRAHPLFHSDTKLPSIRAELVDQPAFQAPASTEMNQLSPANGIYDGSMVTDFDTGTFWAFSHQNSQPHNLHTFDMLSNSEISRVVMDASILDLNDDLRAEWNFIFPDWWTVYDKYNGLVHFQHGFAGTNGVRIGSVQLASGKLVSSYGSSNNNGTTGEDNTGFSFYSSFLRWRAFGTTLHGIALGTLFLQAAVISYRKQQSDASPGNNVKLSHTGVIKGGDTFTFGFDVAHDTDHRPGAICAYPVLDRPELISQYNVDTADFQSGIVLYGDGSALKYFEGNLAGNSPVDGGDASWQTTVAPTVLYDFGQTINTIFVEPQTGSIIVLFGNGGVNTGFARLQPTFGPGQQGGCTLISVEKLWSLPMTDVDPRLLGNMIRNENMSAGTFAYAAGPIVVRSLITGQEVYRHNSGVSLPDDWVYDSVSQTIWLANGSTPTKLSLYGSESSDAGVSEFLTWCGEKLGYPTEDISSDLSITETVIGGAITEPTTVRQAMIIVAAMFSICAVEVGGKLMFVRPLPGENAVLAAVLSKDDLGTLQEGDYEAVNVTTSGANEIASTVTVSCLDPANDYNPTPQTYKRSAFPFQTSKSKANASYAAPIVVTNTDALNIAGRLVLDSFAQATVFEYRLPHRFLNIIPGDVIGFLADDKITVTELSQVREVSYNGDYSQTLKGIRWTLSDSLVLSVDSPAGRQNVTAALPSDSIAMALDMPLIDPTDETPGAALIYTGAGSNGQSWWKSAELHRSMDATLSDLYLATATVPYGIVSETLPPTEAQGVTFCIDRDTVLTLSGRTLNPTMFVSITEEQFRAGHNAIAVGAPGRWELVYFKDVEVVGPNTFRLSTLLRGRRGTNISCDLHTGGEQAFFVKSNGGRAAFRGDRLDFKYRGKLLSYYAVGENTRRSPVPTTFSMSGDSARPWTVRRIRAKVASLINAVNATSYSNECGQGNRQDIISVFGSFNYSDGSDKGPVPQTFNTDYSAANLVDGSTSSTPAHSTTLADGQTDAEIRFDFQSSLFKQIIDEIQVQTFAGGCAGTWDIEATDDPTGSWTSLSTAVSLSGLSPTFSFSNSTGYWFYRFRQTGGTTTDNGALTEFRFKAKAVVADANDLLITWLRRDRLAPSPTWVTESQPLTETTEAYQVEISPLSTLTSNTVSFPKVMPLVNSPRLLYSAAAQAADGFSVPMDIVGVRVTQLGQGVTNGNDVSNRLGLRGLIQSVEVDK